MFADFKQNNVGLLQPRSQGLSGKMRNPGNKVVATATETMRLSHAMNCKFLLLRLAWIRHIHDIASIFLWNNTFTADGQSSFPYVRGVFHDLYQIWCFACTVVFQVQYIYFYLFLYFAFCYCCWFIVPTQEGVNNNNNIDIFVTACDWWQKVNVWFISIRQ